MLLLMPRRVNLVLVYRRVGGGAGGGGGGGVCHGTNDGDPVDHVPEVQVVPEDGLIDAVFCRSDRAQELA